MLALALGAFVARIASRWYVFNAGRDAEYELRFELLRKLQSLGAAFYRKMSSGEIMSRSTSDLQQVRMLLGFGVLNVVNVVFVFASGLQVMLRLSPPLTLACLVNLPVVILISRALSRGMFHRMRENQAALGRMSDRLQANLAGVRVVRSFALEESERARFEQTNREYLEREPRAGAAPRLVRADHRRDRRDRGPRLLLVRLVVAPPGPRPRGSLAGGVLRLLERVRAHDVADDRRRVRAEHRAARPRRFRPPARRFRRVARGGRRSAPRAEARRGLALRREPHVRVRRRARCSTT